MANPEQKRYPFRSKVTSNPISDQSSPKSTAGSVWREIFLLTLEPSPHRANKTPVVAARIANARRQAIDNQNADGEPIELSVNSSSEDDDDDDVTYLYTVDSSSSGRIVPEIDLSQESETANFSGKGLTNDMKPKSSKGEKRKLTGTGGGGPRKRSNNEVVLQCQSCKINFGLSSNGMGMYIGSCGHLFCTACYPIVSLTRCSCGKKVNVLRKLCR